MNDSFSCDIHQDSNVWAPTIRSILNNFQEVFKGRGFFLTEKALSGLTAVSAIHMVWLEKDCKAETAASLLTYLHWYTRHVQIYMNQHKQNSKGSILMLSSTFSAFFANKIQIRTIKIKITELLKRQAPRYFNLIPRDICTMELLSQAKKKNYIGKKN